MIPVTRQKIKALKRTERKAEEFQMAVIRTVFNVVAGVVAVIGLVFTLLIYHKVYFNGGG